MKKYWTIFKSNLAASLEYRGRLFTWALVELASLVAVVFVWAAIFRTNESVAGYDFTKMLTYYLLVPIMRCFTSIFVSDHLPDKIKNGQISADLMKPFSIAAAMFLNQSAIKLTQLTIKLPVFVLVGLFFSVSLGIKLAAGNFFLALGVCLFSYLLHFSLDLLISYFAFWFDDVWSLAHLKSVALHIFGGYSFPLDLLPGGLRGLFGFLPFRFVYYFPVRVAQGMVSGQEFILEFGQLFLWTIGFGVAGQVLWRRGLKKYGAYGN